MAQKWRDIFQYVIYEFPMIFLGFSYDSEQNKNIQNPYQPIHAMEAAWKPGCPTNVPIQRCTKLLHENCPKWGLIGPKIRQKQKCLFFLGFAM